MSFDQSHSSGLGEGQGVMARGLGTLEGSTQLRVKPSGAASAQVFPVPIERRVCLHEMIVGEAALRPEARALIFQGRDYSYHWLETTSRRMAAHLLAAGLQTGDLVGLHLTRSAEMVAAMLAVLRAGAAYLPLDPDFPEERLALILEDAEPALMVSETALDGRLDAGSTPRLLIEVLAKASPPTLEAPQVGLSDLAYVLYTSGSTGRPKGVEITHGAVANLICAFHEDLQFTTADRMLASTTTAFDISVLELFLPLATGGGVVLAGSSEAKDPQALAALMHQAGCTFVQATPSKWRFLIEAGWRGGAGLTLLCGGEALSRELADLLLARCDALWNVYGPTETTVWSTRARVEPSDEAPCIGWPIRNTHLHVLDEAGRRVGVGEVGELHIGGEGLARGYRGRPDLTRERFVVRAGERLYRTGDLVRRRKDGALDCLGRTDHQVKLRGYRVELGEVEAALLACEGVAHAAAVVAGEGAEARLIGYVAPRTGERLDPQLLRDALGRRLPDYMVPARFVVLDVLPFTPNGKIDRKALPPPPDRDVSQTVERDGAPLSAQARLAQIWREVLGVAEVGPDDNFFDLGGYSILILRLLRRIEAEFERSLTMADLFAATDLKAMAARLDEAPTAPALNAVIPLQPQGDRPPLIWFDVGPQLRALAARLAPHQPFIGLNLEAVAERSASGGRLDAAEVGAELVRTLRRHQPRGPYYLGGWCRWGVMAYAAARQLEQEGEEVRLLVMLDAVNATSPYQAVKRRARSVLQAVGGRDGTAPRPVMAALTTEVEAASLRYRPQIYRGDVLLLCSRDGEPDLDGCSGWRKVVRGDLEVYRASGDHASVLEAPQVAALGDVLLNSLVRAQNRTSTLI